MTPTSSSIATGNKREEHEAEIRLDEAKLSQSKKTQKSLEGVHDGLSDLSAGLDKDLGFSKGLPGLADNLVRFLGALATAPLKALLDPIAKQGDGSSGLLGMMFGGTAKEQQQGGYAPNYPGAPGVSGMPGVPGESARDFAHRAMMPYWQSQGFTVGDHAADQYGEHQNGALDIMVPNIDAGNRVLQQMVNDPNVYGAIFNNKTYGYGHGATPQDYTAGHTGNPTQDHQDHVHGWYKPGGPNNIVPGMAGGPLNTGMPRGLPTGAPLGTVGPAGSPMAGYQSPAPYSAQGMPQAQQGWQPQGGGGIGFGGGLIGMAADAAISAGALAGAPFGGGAAAAGAKMAQQLLDRSVKFGGQLAGIGSEAVMSTLTPSNPDTGSSPIADSWLWRLAGSLAGASPSIGAGAAGALDRQAQKKQAEDQGQQQNPQQGQQSPAQSGPLLNIENWHAGGQSNKGNAMDVAATLSAQNLLPR